MKLDLYDTYGKRFIAQLEYHSHIDKAGLFVTYLTERKNYAFVSIKHRKIKGVLKNNISFPKCVRVLISRK